jgi:hypothetical protein
MICGISAVEFYNLYPWQVLAYIQAFAERQKMENIRFANLGIIIASIFAKDNRHARTAQNSILAMYALENKKSWKPKTMEETKAFIAHAKKLFGDE